MPRLVNGLEAEGEAVVGRSSSSPSLVVTISKESVVLKSLQIVQTSQETKIAM